ncbi:Methyltransferase FkbM [Gracilaria domingensis]|nr:Methyltransferase FkbM [Gracilaria domingensis]
MSFVFQEVRIQEDQREFRSEKEYEVIPNEEDQKVDNARKKSFCDKQLRGKRIHDMTNILSLFKKPITLLDVGTNVGIISLTALYCLNVSHSTLSIEPVPMNARQFMEDVRRMGNAMEDGRIVFREIGFSNVNEMKDIYVPHNRGSNAALSEIASTARSGEHPIQAVPIMLRKGDEVIHDMVTQLKHQRDPQIIKIDTQGNEPLVLAGMKDFLTKHREEGLMVFAEHDVRLLRTSGFHAYAVYDFMKRLGYRVYCKPEVSVSDNGYGDLQVRGEPWKRDYMTSKSCLDLIYWAGKE